MLITPCFKKSLIVEQFQRNYLKLLNKVSKQNTSWNVKRDFDCRENTADM